LKKKYIKTKKNCTWKQVQKQAKEHMQEAYGDNIDLTFKHVRNHPKSYKGLDGEVNIIKVKDMIEITWCLAKKLDAEGFKGCRNLVGLSFYYNIKDGGWCMPGLVARLYAVYARMVKAWFIRKVNGAPKLKSQIIREEYDNNFNAALQNSMQSAEQENGKRENNRRGFFSDEDMKEALRQSKEKSYRNRNQ